MSNTDPALAQAYAVLGLTPAAARAQVTRTFRRLVRGEHPDISQTRATDASETARIRDIIDAYHTIQAARRVEQPPPTPARAPAPPAEAPISRGYLTAGPVRPGAFTRHPDIHASAPTIE